MVEYMNKDTYVANWDIFICSDFSVSIRNFQKMRNSKKNIEGCVTAYIFPEFIA